jgi:hypothetical protein
MEKQRTLSRSLALLLVAVVLAILASPALASADWQKMDPPPDVDKPEGHECTCWLATAANMLAGAGYGDGANVQQRAVDIYNELFAYWGDESGWTDTAISWWLQSVHNTWKGSNPYTVVTIYSNTTAWMCPWDNPNGAQFIGNQLRRCQMVGLSIRWPTSGPSAGLGAHAITAWGDSGNATELTTNPAQVIVADSDRDTGGDVQTYNYDAYNNPNPGRSNEGNGWYINYDDNHPYIRRIYTLCPTDDPSDEVMTQKVVGSYSIHQDNDKPATDLHYRVGTVVDILSYRTAIDWQTDKPPTILEDSPRWLTVDWDLSSNPVPYSTWVTITTEFVLPYWNAIEYQDVYFTYPSFNASLPVLKWVLSTPELIDPSVADVCGGYVVGSFDLFADPTGQNLIGKYRFLHEYDYFQDPELHYFSLVETEQTQEVFVGNLCFGHSYGFLDTDSLWGFEEWMTYDPDIVPLNQGKDVELDWDGLLPYPAGDGPPIPTLPHDLTVNSTAGGLVTTPGEGIFIYEEGTVVNLVATPDAGYKFVEWTGNISTIADVEDATTTITMNDDYSITANFKEVPSGRCFITTAAYGTPIAEEIQVLRDFRDEYLLTNPLGQALVDLYYKVSPPMAGFITEHSRLKPIVRAGLLPAVAMSTIAISATPTDKADIVGLLVLVSVALVIWATRRRGREPEYT